MKFKRPTPVFGKQKEVKFTKLEGREPIREGWIEFRKAIPISAPAEMFALIKQAYFGGAVSLFGALMQGLDDGTDETPGDLAKMERIQNELDYFRLNQRDFLTEAFQECEARRTAQ